MDVWSNTTGVTISGTAISTGALDMQSTDSRDLGPTILVVCWAMTLVAALFLGARLFVKLTTHKRLWWDDWLLVASWFMLVAFSITTTYGVKIGIGRHHATMGESVKTTELQLVVVVATVFSVLGASWSKTSFAITLLRITFGPIYYIVWLIIVSMNIILTFNAVLQFLWCQPASVAWNGGRGGTCWSQHVIVYYSISAAAYSAGMDILLAMVPWAVIMRLKMQMKEKLGVAVCMSLGLIAAITSIFRAYHIPALYSDDYSYDESTLFVWTAAEMATTIIATSIPVLRALLTKVVSSTRRDCGESQFAKTFRNGTYACSTVSRGQSYRRMGDGTYARKGSDGLAGISENGESVTSLVIVSEKGPYRDLEHGGILKTEEITVNYDRRSRHEGDGIRVDNSALGFELQEVSPVYARPESR